MWVHTVQLRHRGEKLAHEYVLGCAPYVGWLVVDDQWGALRWAENCGPPFDVISSLYSPRVRIKRGAVFVFGEECPDYNRPKFVYPQAWWCRPIDPPALDRYGRALQPSRPPRAQVAASV